MNRIEHLASHYWCMLLTHTEVSDSRKQQSHIILTFDVEWNKCLSLHHSHIHLNLFAKSLSDFGAALAALFSGAIGVLLWVR